MGWVRISETRLRWVDETKPQKQKARSHYIIPDIEPYKAVGGDMAGKYITSRSQHREFLKRNGFEEVGNDSGQSIERDRRDSERTRDKRLRDELARHISRRS